MLSPPIPKKLRLSAREATTFPLSPQNHNFYATLDKLCAGRALYPPIEEESSLGVDIEASYFPNIPTNQSPHLTTRSSQWFGWKKKHTRGDGTKDSSLDERGGCVEWRVGEGKWHRSSAMGGWTALTILILILIYLNITAL